MIVDETRRVVKEGKVESERENIAACLAATDRLTVAGLPVIWLDTSPEGGNERSQ